MRHRFVALGVTGILLFAVGCGDDDSTSTDTTSTTVAGTSQTTGTTEGTSTTVATDLSTAVWPSAGSATYDDPVAVATDFATEFVGFTDPVVGEFQQGDSRSGEVQVRPIADGPTTTIFVRQIGSEDSWYVLGAATANIEVTAPETGATITSPVSLQGRSTAFEANVQVRLTEDGSDTALGEGFVMGGSMGEMGPFDDSLTFSAPTASSGALMFSTLSMENGQVWEAGVMRVHFG